MIQGTSLLFLELPSLYVPSYRVLIDDYMLEDWLAEIYRLKRI